MKKSPLADKLLDETKRIMERLVNTPHKMHKDEPSHKPAKKAKPKVRL